MVIYTDDHPPPHVHIFGDGETKIALGENAAEVQLVRVVGASFAESRRAMRIVRDCRDNLLEQWNAIHG